MKSILFGLVGSFMLLFLVVLEVPAADEPPANPKNLAVPAATKATTESVDPMIARIRDEGLNHSQVMATLDTLCNVIGPRLTGSPSQVRASEWTRDQLSRWALADAHLEPWGKFGRGWAVRRFELETIEPTAVDLTAVPKAWSPGVDGPVEADAIFLDAKTARDLEKYRGQLKGKIVLIGSPRPVAAHFDPQALRMDDAELKKLADAESGADIGISELMKTASSAVTRPAAIPTTGPTSRPSSGFGARAFYPAAMSFAMKEGAIMVLDPSGQGDGGTVYVAQASLPRPDLLATTQPDEPQDPAARRAAAMNRPKIWAEDAPATIPQATLAAEQYNRIVSQLNAGERVRLSVDMRVQFTPADPAGPADTIAEISGTDLKDQVVMVGGHLDSWHGGTGATDNAAGAAAAMEAIRIIRALDLHPRRTIRVALWTGEEEGLYGSTAYVTKHFGKTEMQPTSRPSNSPTTEPTSRPTGRGFRRPTVKVIKGPEYEKLSVYFNLDNGTGKVRGIYAQGNRPAAELFRKWLVPVHDLGATTVTLSNTDSTDHMPFDDIGLPGFQFIQDPIEYGTRTHHSNADVYERLQPDDLREAATVMAVFLWDAANTDERFPRK